MKHEMLPCLACGATLPYTQFIPVTSQFFPKGLITICNKCIEKMVGEAIQKDKMGTDSCAIVDLGDRLCQWININFDPEDWIKLVEQYQQKAFNAYATRRVGKEYNNIGWGATYKRYIELQEAKKTYQAYPTLYADKIATLRAKWGQEYVEEELFYLEDLYDGILQTMNITGKLQIDDAVKLCKISLMINQKIRGGEDFEKLLKSYDTLRKNGNFTPKNVKNAYDFDSVGEVFAYLERRKWINKLYDGVKRDAVDVTISNIQAYLRNLYKNESGIGEDIDRRIEGLKLADELEEDLLSVKDDGLDDLDIEAYTDFEHQEFDAEAGI